MPIPSPSLIQPSGLIDQSRFILKGPDGSEAAISELREGFRQGFVFELLDLERPDTPLEVFVMVLNPVRYSLSEPFQATLTPSQGNTVVSEENGIIIREISIEGTFGLSTKNARGFVGAQGGGQPLSGTAHFNKLRNLFRRYSALKKDPNRSANIQLIFHALRDDDHFVVVPRSFDTPRDAARARVHYDYSIKLTAKSEAIISALRATPDTSDFDFTDALRDISEAFNDGRAAIAELTAGLADIRRKVGNIQAVVTSASQFLNAVGGFVSGVNETINYPMKLAATCAEQLENAADTLVTEIENLTYGPLDESARSLRRLESAIERIMMYDDRFQNVAQNIEALFEGERSVTSADVAASSLASSPGAGGVTIGSRTRAVAGSDGRLAGLDVPRESGLAIVRVQRTDSLESIAATAGTTPEAIIIINDLRPPYLAAGGGPGILKPGDTLLVPTSHLGGSSTGNGAIDYLTPEDVLYGVDMAIDRALLEQTGEFDITVDRARGSFDCELVRGIKNVVQGTEITINTERGTMQIPELADIGIRRNVGTPGTVQHVILSSITLREAILSDPRISGIESSRVVLDGDVLSQEITPIVSGAKAGATLVLPFGRASGGG